MWATGLYSAKYTVRSLCEYMGAARDALSMGTIEVKLGDIPEGKSVTFTWRGKPLFVRHRVDSEIAKENAVPMGELRDPQTDAVSVFICHWQCSIASMWLFCLKLNDYQFTNITTLFTSRNVLRIQNGWSLSEYAPIWVVYQLLTLVISVDTTVHAMVLIMMHQEEFVRALLHSISKFQSTHSKVMFQTFFSGIFSIESFIE